MSLTSAQSPPIRPRVPAASATRQERLAAAIFAVLCLALLVVSSCLRPSAEGMGTHTQLGLPACGWLLATGYPCPTCGMTTSFAAAANSSILASARAQPFGTLLAVGTAIGFWGCLHVAAFGSRIGRICARMASTPVLVGLVILFLLSWGYKALAIMPKAPATSAVRVRG